MPEISVIMPAYNAEKHIGEAIQSVFEQTFEDWELVVVDDGSTDNTRDIVKSFGSRVKCLIQENQGPASARNLAIQNSEGKYIAFLDADDIWESGKLEKQLSAFNKGGKTGFVYSDAEFVDEEGQVIQNYVRKVKMLDGDILLPLFREYFLMTPSVVLLRECIKYIGLFRTDLPVGEDYDFFLRLATYSHASVIREKLFKRRVHSQSLSRRDYRLDYEVDLKILKYYLKSHSTFAKENSAVVRERLGNHFFDYAYRSLERGNNINAFIQLIRMCPYELSTRVLKNMLACFIPNKFRVQLKGAICQK